MPSPFPGMDPYLEAHWGDVHTRLVTFASVQLQPLLPRDLRARVEEQIYVETETGRPRMPRPDVRIFERPGRPSTPRQSAAGLALAEPVIVHLPEPAGDPMTERRIEIRETGRDGRVITVIEFLSPANKRPGIGRDRYRLKQQECLDGGVNLVEIDLLRSGPRVLIAPDEFVPESHRTPCRICVRRGSYPFDVEVYRAPLRVPLPRIGVPLRETDDDVPLDVQRLLEQVYDTGGYDDYFDYAADPEPPLEPEDAAWADALLREKGLR